MNPFSSYQDQNQFPQGNPFNNGQSRGQNNQGRNGGRNNHGRRNGNQDVVGNDMMGYPPTGPASYDNPNPRYKGNRYDPDHHLKQGFPVQQDYTVQAYQGQSHPGQSHPGQSHPGKKKQGKKQQQGHGHQGLNPPQPFPAKKINQGTYIPSNLGPGRLAPTPAPAGFMPPEDLSGDIEMLDADDIAPPPPKTKRSRVEKEHADLVEDIKYLLKDLLEYCEDDIVSYLQLFVADRGESPLAAIIRQL